MTYALADELVLALAQSDRRAVTEHCTALVRDGLSLESLVDQGLAPAMREVGSLWEGGVWTVFDEHLATAVAEAGLSAAAAEVGSMGHDHGELVVGCVEGDWHSLPVRMVAEVLATQGWGVRFLGASQPTASLVDHVRRHRPNAVLLSCAVPMPLPALASAIVQLHGIGLPVYVGGRAVASADRASALGADGWASSAGETLDLLHRAPRRDSHDMADALARWTARSLDVEDWLDASMTELRSLLPYMEDYPVTTIGRTREDLQHLIETASTSLLLQEQELLIEQCTWLARLLAARGVPADALPQGLIALQRTVPAGADADALDALLGAAHDSVAA